jgi:hypothetical protein
MLTSKRSFKSIVNHGKKEFTTYTHIWLHLVQSVLTCKVLLLGKLDGSHINDLKEVFFYSWTLHIDGFKPDMVKNALEYVIQQIFYVLVYNSN